MKRAAAIILTTIGLTAVTLVTTLVLGFLKYDAAARDEFTKIAEYHNRVQLMWARGDKEFAAVEEHCVTSALELVNRKKECAESLTRATTVIDEIEQLRHEAHTYDLSNYYLNPELAKAIQNWKTLSNSPEHQKFIQSMREYISIYQTYVSDLDEALITKDINTMTPAEITRLRQYMALFNENIKRLDQAEAAALRDGQAMQAFAEANNLIK